MGNVKACSLFCLCFLAASELQAAVFTSSKGFSLEYPDDWVVASKEQRETMSTEIRRAFNKIGAPDLEKMAVVILNLNDDEFAENINVVIGEKAPRIKQDSDKEYAKAMRQQLSQLGLRPNNLTTEVTTIASRKAISARYDVDFPGGVGKVRQWQVIIPAAGKTYVITCSARPADFAATEPIFSKTINSLQISAGLAGLWHQVPAPLRYALIGGLIGGLVGVVVFLSRKLASGSAMRGQTSQSTTSRALPDELPGDWGQGS